MGWRKLLWGWLLLDTPLRGKERRYAENARRSADALLSVIDDILDLSRTATGKMKLEKVPFDPRELAEDVLEILSAPARAQDLELTCLISGESPPPLLGDPGRIKQILINLVINPVKFTEAGGIQLTISRQSETPEAVRLEFQVQDSGGGIAPEALPRVFNAFYQEDGPSWMSSCPNWTASAPAGPCANCPGGSR